MKTLSILEELAGLDTEEEREQLESLLNSPQFVHVPCLNPA